jgi:hypothetical protein
MTLPKFSELFPDEADIRFKQLVALTAQVVSRIILQSKTQNTQEPTDETPSSSHKNQE